MLFGALFNCDALIFKVLVELLNIVSISDKGPFTNTCKVGLMQKIFIVKIFQGPPSDRKKNSGPPFLPWKLRVNPIEKHVNSIFNGKSVVIFFSGPPLQGSKILRAPLFASGPPYKCLWTVPKWDSETWKIIWFVLISRHFHTRCQISCIILLCGVTWFEMKKKKRTIHVVCYYLCKHWNSDINAVLTNTGLLLRTNVIMNLTQSTCAMCSLNHNHISFRKWAPGDFYPMVNWF